MALQKLQVLQFLYNNTCESLALGLPSRHFSTTILTGFTGSTVRWIIPNPAGVTHRVALQADSFLTIQWCAECCGLPLLQGSGDIHTKTYLYLKSSKDMKMRTKIITSILNTCVGGTEELRVEKQ